MKQIACSSNSLHLNHKSQTIEMTKAFYKEASIFGSKAYKTLNEARRDYPNYDFVILRQKAKDSHKGLTLKKMKNFFDNHSEEYAEAKELFENVSFVDGKIYHRTGKDYRDMWRTSDELCKEYRLSTIDIKSPHYGKHKSYGEWRAEQEGRPTWRGLIKEDIDRCIRESMTDRQFFVNLKKAGYEVKIGKDISIKPPGKERFVRLARNFGEDYTVDGIIKRIISQQRPSLPMPEYKTKPKVMKLRGEIKPRKKASGFRALYFHYCYLLGVFKRKKPQNNRKMHFLLKEDLIKMDKFTDEARLLGRNRIDTEQQLSSYKKSLEVRLNELIPERRKLYRKQNEEGVKEEISEINKEIAVIRKEMNLCDDIAVRSRVMREKLKKIRKDQTKENEQRKEKSRNDKLR